MSFASDLQIEERSMQVIRTLQEVNSMIEIKGQQLSKHPVDLTLICVHNKFHSYIVAHCNWASLLAAKQQQQMYL